MVAPVATDDIYATLRDTPLIVGHESSFNSQGTAATSNTQGFAAPSVAFIETGASGFSGVQGFAGLLEVGQIGFGSSALSDSQGFAGTLVSGGVIAGDLVRDGVATPHQLALVVENLAGLDQAATASIRIRTASPVGAWSTSRPLFRVQPARSEVPPWGAIEDVFAWVFFGLEPGTTYDVELTKALNPTVDVDLYQFTTKSLPTETLPAITTTIPGGSSQAVAQSLLNGAAAAAGANPIHVRIEDGTINGGLTIPSSLSGASEASPAFITGQSENAIISESTNAPILELNSVSNLVIQDLSGVGAGTNDNPSFEGSTFIFSGGSASATNVTVRRCTATGIMRGIYMRGPVNQTADQHGILVYDNTFTGTNTWNETDIRTQGAGGGWDDYGFLVAGDGHAFFNNTLTGFGDVFSTTSGSTGQRSEQDRSQHFYWNDINIGLDDVVELDDGYRNISCYQNRFRNIVNAGSADPFYGGPYICWGNLFINVLETRMFKWNTDSSGMFMYNNTFAMTDKIYRSQVSQDNFAMWYQPTSGTNSGHAEIAIANNIFVMVNGPPTDNILQNDASWYGNRDIHHNSWFPDGPFSSNAQSGASLAAFQAAQPSTSGIFESFNQFENDNIAVAQPWSSTINLGATALTEVTNDYGWSDFQASDSSIANTGRAIPNITDNLTETYDGVAPDRGANISGLTAPVFGNRNVLPSWLPAVGEIGVIPSSNTAGQIIRADGAVPGYGGTDPDDIFTPWSGAGVITLNGQRYLAPYGGGHNDSHYNGIPRFGPLESDSPSWSLHLGGSAAGSANGQATYPDGRQAACHTYGATVGIGDRLYVMASTEFPFIANSSNDAFYFTSAGQTPIAPAPFVGANNARLACVYSEVDDRIYVAEANTTSNTLRYYNVTADTWGSISGTSETMRLYSVMALDSTRNNLLYLSGAGNEGIFYDPDAGTVQASKNFPSSYFSNIVYDPVRDVYVHIPNNSTTIQELDASAINASGGNPTWQNRVFTGTPPVGETGLGIGFYSRVQYISLSPTVGGYLVAPQIDSDVYFYRST